MQHLIQIEDFPPRLEKSIEDAKYTFRTRIRIRHFYECLKLSFSLEECGNVCIDILPRVEKTGFTFLVIVNIESDVGQTKEYLKKQLEALLQEPREETDEFLGSITAPNAKVMFFLLGSRIYLFIKG